MTGKRWAFEDLAEGHRFDLGEKLVTADEIVEFAREFDPQPMHLDEAAGKTSLLGGLSASGWHTCCMFMRMLCDAFLLDSTSQGSFGIDHAKWRKPVLAGDVLKGSVTVVARRGSKSLPNVGLVTILSELTNQRGEQVLEMKNTAMFLARETA